MPKSLNDLKVKSAKRPILTVPSLWVVAYPDLCILLCLVAVHLLLRWVLVISLPPLATAGAVAMFLLPGALLSILLPRSGELLERLAHAFAISAAILGIPALIVSVLHLSIKDYVFLYAGITGILIPLTFLRLWFVKQRDAVASESPGTANPWLTLFMLAGLVAVCAINFHAPLNGDDLLAIGFIKVDLMSERLHLCEPFHGANIPANARMVWGSGLIIADFIAYTSGVDPAVMFAYFRLLLLPLSIGAFYGLARELFGRRDQAAFTTAFWLIYHLTILDGRLSGYELIVRTGQDKFIARFILLPIALQLLISFFRCHRRQDLRRGIIVILGMSPMHPIGPVLLGLCLAGFGLIHLFYERNFQTFFALSLIALVLLLTVVISILLAQDMADERISRDLVDPNDPGLYVRLAMVFDAHRLWPLDNGQYVLHPFLVLRWEILLAYLGLPLLIRLWPRSLTARLLSGIMLVLPFFLYVPPIAVLVGRQTTPWLFYRLVWPLYLSCPLIVSWGAWAVVHKLSRNRLTQIGPLIALFAITAIVAPNIRQGLIYLSQIKVDLKLYKYHLGCEQVRPLLTQLNASLQEDSVVLTHSYLQLCVPLSSPRSKVIEYRRTFTVNRFPPEREAEAWQRIQDVNVFNTAQVVDREFLAILDRWNVRFILIRTDSPLESQLSHLSSLFGQVAQSDLHAVYKVNQTGDRETEPIISANSALSERDRDLAIAQYQTALEGDQDTLFLTYLGLGRAYLGQGKLTEAIEAFKQATRINGRDEEAHVLLGDACRLNQQFDQAVQAYQQALSVNPSHSHALEALGDMHRAMGDKAAARQAYERAIELWIPKSSDDYYLQLGNKFSAIGWYEEALELYKQAMSIMETPLACASMAQVYQELGDWESAEVAYRQAERLDRWDPIGPQGLGEILRLRGQSEQAIDEYLWALQLNPTASGYSHLGSLWQDKWGAVKALEQTKQLIGYRLGVASARTAAAGLLLGSGQLEEAIEETRLATIWSPLDAELFAPLGGLQAASGAQSDAIESFRQAAILGDSVGSFLGLGDVYLSQGRVGAAKGAFWQAALTSLGQVDPHISLGHLYQRQGEPTLALAEYERAVELKPQSPAAVIALGGYYEVQAAPSKAMSLYQQAIEMEPTFAAGC
jgi:tetratricopeptide (TPR) repeat protein